MELKDEPNELGEAPILRSLRGTDPFVVPESFFDTFPHAVQQRALATAAPRSVSPWRRILRPALAMGAVALIAIIGLRWPASAPLEDPAPLAVQDWTPEDLVRSGVDIRSVQTLLGPEESQMDVIELPDDDHAVIAYLENEDLPLDLLIEEL